MDKQLLLGNEAVARAAYEAGATVATAYPGTPSTEITANIAKYDEIYCEWSPNEKVALEVAIGASIAGARAICSMKHVGLNVAADPLFTVSYTGVNGGLVIMAADDPGMHSSQNEQDSRYYGISAKVPVLEPADSQECLTFVKEAFRLSEEFDTPVIVRLTTRVSHSRSLVALSGREDYKLKEYVKDVNKYVMMPAMARGRHLAVEKRMAAIGAHSEATALNRVMEVGESDSAVEAGESDSVVEAGGRKYPAILTSGISWQYTHEALQNLGLKPGVDISVIKLGMIHPMPKGLICKFLSKAGNGEALTGNGKAPTGNGEALTGDGKALTGNGEALTGNGKAPTGNGKVLVVEELSPIYENAVRSYGLGVEVHGKDMLPVTGEYTAAMVKEAILALADVDACGSVVAGAGAVGGVSTDSGTVDTGTKQAVAVKNSGHAGAPAGAQAPLPVRPPVLCPGCPHNSVFSILKKLKLIVCGDIGCYTLGALPPFSAIDACVCMGASVGMAHGIDKARGGAFTQKTVAVIGDSTFIHSGITGLIDIVYNRGCSTVLILDNDTTGMTGHQHHPSTGYTIRDEETYRLDIAKLCEAVGVRHVRTEDPFDMEALEKAIREEIRRPEPSVIVVRRSCVFLKSYRPEKAVHVDEGACRDCKMCLKLACSAISEKGGKITINQALCARCGLCSKICKFNAIVPIDEPAGGDTNG